MKHSPVRYVGLALACSALLVATSAFAQSAEPPTTSDPPPAKTFQELDANADGFVSVDEAAVDAELSKDFARRDADADGKLTEVEFKADEAPPAESTDAAAEKKDG